MFYSTEDAIAQGLHASPGKKLWWIMLRKEFTWQFQAAMNRKQLKLAAWMATQAQLCREAHDAEKIVTLRSVVNLTEDFDFSHADACPCFVCRRRAGGKFL